MICIMCYDINWTIAIIPMASTSAAVLNLGPEAKAAAAAAAIICTEANVAKNA